MYGNAQCVPGGTNWQPRQVRCLTYETLSVLSSATYGTIITHDPSFNRFSTCVWYCSECHPTCNMSRLKEVHQFKLEGNTKLFLFQ